MHTLVHRIPSLVLILRIQPLIPMRLLHTLRRRLEGCDINCITFDQRLSNGDDIRDKAINHVQRQTFTHNYSKNLCLLFIGWQWVICLCQVVM